MGRRGEGGEKEAREKTYMRRNSFWFSSCLGGIPSPLNLRDDPCAPTRELAG